MNSSVRISIELMVSVIDQIVHTRRDTRAQYRTIKRDYNFLIACLLYCVQCR